MEIKSFFWSMKFYFYKDDSAMTKYRLLLRRTEKRWFSNHSVTVQSFSVNRYFKLTTEKMLWIYIKQKTLQSYPVRWRWFCAQAVIVLFWTDSYRKWRSVRGMRSVWSVGTVREFWQISVSQGTENYSAEQISLGEFLVVFIVEVV